MSDDQPTTEERWAQALAVIYRAWVAQGDGRRKDAMSVFERRLLRSSYERGVPQVIQRLCGLLNAGTPAMPIEALDELIADSGSMQVLRGSTKYITLLAAARSKEMSNYVRTL